MEPLQERQVRRAWLSLQDEYAAFSEQADGCKAATHATFRAKGDRDDSIVGVCQQD
jgi:hypothetical protein